MTGDFFGVTFCTFVHVTSEADGLVTSRVFYYFSETRVDGVISFCLCHIRVYKPCDYTRCLSVVEM